VNLRNRIEIVQDDAIDPHGAAISVTLNNGAVISASATNCIGSPENPLSDAQVEQKFRSLVGNRLASDDLNRLLSILWSLEEHPSIGDMIQLMTRSQKKMA
jgi:2-methylcitrate dehydratase PrpD